MSLRPLLAVVALVVTPGVTGCSGHSSGSDTAGAQGATTSAASCTTIPTPPVSQLPHIVATGSNASAIEQALDAIFASQTPPIMAGQTYAVPSLYCGDVGSGFGPSGNTCTLQVQIGGGQPVTITLAPPSALALALANALFAAGSTSAVQKEVVDAVSASNMTVSASGVQYDDSSCYAAFDPPNIVVRGADAQGVVDAVAAAGIDDCDPTRYVFLECSSLGGGPSCGAQFMPLQTVGSSDLIPMCMGEGETWPGPSIDASASMGIWQAILTAAMDAGFQPMSGTLAQTTVINARYFTWDGTSLTFSLVQGNATPPAPPGDAGGP